MGGRLGGGSVKRMKKLDQKQNAKKDVISCGCHACTRKISMVYERNNPAACTRCTRYKRELRSRSGRDDDNDDDDDDEDSERGEPERVIFRRIADTRAVSATYQIRLVGGNTDNEGRLEIRKNSGPWGMVCDDSWTFENAFVACKMLGYRQDVMACVCLCVCDNWWRSKVICSQHAQLKTVKRSRCLDWVGKSLLCSERITRALSCYFERLQFTTWKALRALILKVIFTSIV
ncbi:hypothetical protein BSL78_22852 [Apostichopus japonicus]|uniref:SRCR domain-containing protein n=1 Tax=Stichopus japonicus TaxID=307972 RepID=A0A2G8JWZ4_STIJA|nr:hypothetical protein BSL78_22852 [Apostichopus japonicus]